MPDPLRTTHQRLQLLLDEALAAEDVPTETVRATLQELMTVLEELRVAEEELMTQSEQLAASAHVIDEERERFVELFEFAPDAYVETDELGKIVEANQATATLLGIPVRALRGKLLITSVHPDDRRRFRHLLHQVVEDGAADETQVRMVTRDGRSFAAGITVAHQQHRTLSSSQLRWLVRDITERIKLQDEVDQLAEEVDVLTRAAEVQRLVAGDDPLAATLEAVVRLADDLLPGCEIGMTLIGRSDMERRLATGARARELDVRQWTADEGPCVEAVRRRANVRGRPADWAVLADVDDVVEIVGVPIIDDGQVAGALNVYAVEEELGEREMQLLEILTRQASIALENAALFAASANLVHGLQSALATRGVIERAKGVLMARQGVTDDEAFDILRRASQRENVKLYAIAGRVLQGAPPLT